jgi:DNA-binding response OmpR family regulator
VRILVAEDHPTLARSIAQGLREEGYAVDLTFRGDEALDLATRQPYDCIVLDMMLPGMDGFQLIPTLRKSKVLSPVVCLTARDAMEDRVKGLDLGADDYIVKPFQWAELLARVRAVIRRAHQQPSTVLTVADLEIDMAAKSCKRAGKSIRLSAREFALLSYMAHRVGQIVTRADIHAHLYDEHDDVTSNVVDVYIAYLRNKIDKEFEPKLIHTRHRQGYVLTPEPDTV